jgi:hypothetical protein
MNSTFNIFQYLQIKGIDGEQQKNYFKELDEANDRINEFLLQNPDTKVKDIKIKFLDDSAEKVLLDIHIEKQ